MLINGRHIPSTKATIQYRSLLAAERIAYNKDKEAHRKHFQGRNLRRHNRPPRKTFKAWRAAADALYAFQQAHLWMFLSSESDR